MPIERTRNVLRTSLGIRSRVRFWSGEPRSQYENSSPYDIGRRIRLNFTRTIVAAKIRASPWYSLRIAGKVAVTAENGLPIVGIGNDQDVGFVISRACNHPSFCLARIVG